MLKGQDPARLAEGKQAGRQEGGRAGQAGREERRNPPNLRDFSEAST